MDALLGATRFQQFESNLGIAKNVLSDRLAKLVDHGVMTKERLDEPGQRYAYRLTRKGRDLWIPITALRLWGDKWVFGEAEVPASGELEECIADLLATLTGDLDEWATLTSNFTADVRCELVAGGGSEGFDLSPRLAQALADRAVVISFVLRAD